MQYITFATFLTTTALPADGEERLVHHSPQLDGHEACRIDDYVCLSAKLLAGNIGRF